MDSQGGNINKSIVKARDQLGVDYPSDIQEMLLLTKTRTTQNKREKKKRRTTKAK